MNSVNMSEFVMIFYTPVELRAKGRHFASVDEVIIMS